MDPSTLPMAERVRRLKESYTSEAPVYEATWASGLKEMGGRLLEHLDLGRAERVADVGAGVGTLLPEIAARAPRATVIGVDMSEGMIARAPRQFCRAVMDATRLALQSSSVDVAVVAFVLFHLPDPLDGLAEAHRILRPGGRIGTATWAPEDILPAREVWSAELDAYGADPPAPLLAQHDLVDSPEKVENLLAKAGFTDIRAWGDTLRRQFARATFIQRMTGMAIAKRRLDSLDPDARKRFLASAPARLDELEDAAFLLTAEVVFATGIRP